MTPIKRSSMVRVALIGIMLMVAQASALALERDSIAKLKADFIINVAQNIRYPDTNDTAYYKIGVYGRGRDINALVKELNGRKRQHILGKRVKLLMLELHHFRRTGQIEPVDLIYVTGDSRIRFSDLNKKLDGNPYIILTENFPFGTSSLNFVVNDSDELQFEIHAEALRGRGAIIDSSLLAAPNRITSEKDWDRKLKAAMRVIDVQELTIVDQVEEIGEKSKVIQYQRLSLAVAVFSLLIISGLGFLLYLSDRQKKAALTQVMDSINYAQRIQNALLPRQELIKKYLKESFVLFRPKDVVSGDFYWVEAQENRVFFTVADCTGHGVPGALMSVLCSTSLTKCVKELKIYEPSKILDKTVEILENQFSKGDDHVPDGMDLALCCLDLNQNELSYSGANSPLYYIRNGELKEIVPTRQPVGKHVKSKPFNVHSLKVMKGDCFYLFSDGFADQFGGPKGKKFKYPPLRELLLRIHDRPMDEQKRILEENLDSWKGDLEQIDDICIMGVRV